MFLPEFDGRESMFQLFQPADLSTLEHTSRIRRGLGQRGKNPLYIIRREGFFEHRTTRPRQETTGGRSQCVAGDEADTAGSVSYTHLTLPTSDLV